MPRGTTVTPVDLEGTTVPLPVGAATETTAAEIAADLPVLQLGPRVPGEGLAVAPASFRVNDATAIDVTVEAGQTWTAASWLDTSGVSQVITTFRSNQEGTYYLDFSADGVTADTIAPGTLPAGADLPVQFAPYRKFYRPRFQNTTGNQATVRIETTARANPGIIGSRVSDPVGPSGGAAIVKSVPIGYTEGGGVYKRASFSPEGHQEVVVVGPTTAFGELAVALDTPAIHVAQFQYGVLSRLVGSTVTGSGSIANGTGTERTLLIASTGATIGSEAWAHSSRRLNYKAGLGIKATFTCRFTTPTAGTTQIAGLFDQCDGIGVGLNGTEPGILYRAFGRREIWTLTVNVGTTLAEDITITLNGSSKIVAVGAASTTTQTANAIAQAGWGNVGNGWDAYATQPSAGNPQVVFTARTAEPRSGSYSLSSTGAAAGTFAQTTAGIAQTDTWIPKAQWNVDQLDGSSTPAVPSETNPSGVLLDPTKMNVVKLQLQYLGAGDLFIAMENPGNGQWTPIHIVKRAGLFTTTTFGNISLPISLWASNGATTTDVKVASGSLYAATEGRRLILGPAVAAVATATVTSADRPILTIRNDLTFNGEPNHNPLIVTNISLVNLGGTVSAIWKLWRGATLQNTASFTRVSSATPMSVDITATTLSGGELVEILPQPAGEHSPLGFDPTTTDVTLVLPGETLTITCSISTANTTATASVSARWDV